MPLDINRLRNHPALARILENNVQESMVSGNMSSGGTRVFGTGAMSSGLATYGQHAAITIRDKRDREKREITELNNRLARYIEKVRFLEAQNRVLEGDIDLFRSAASIHAQKISVFFEAERKSLHTLISESEAKRNTFQKQINGLEPEINGFKQKYTQALEDHNTNRGRNRESMKKLSYLEAENACVKREIAEVESENGRVKGNITRLRNEITRVRTLRDKEKSSSSANKAQELVKKINANIAQHEMKIREEIGNARRDSTNKNREAFHKDLHSAIRDIRDKFEKDARHSRTIWEEWYRKKIVEIKQGSEKMSSDQTYAREEVLRIRSTLLDIREKLSDLETKNMQLYKRIEDLKFSLDEDLQLFETALTEKESAVHRMRAECTALTLELDKLIENQTTLHAEISFYRKLIDQAENIRTTTTSDVIMDGPMPTNRITSYHAYGAAYNNYDSYSSHQYDVVAPTPIPAHRVTFKPDLTEFKRSYKGDVAFLDHSLDGKSITIENMNSIRSIDISNWKLVHFVRGEQVAIFYFPVATHIQPKQTITVVSRTHEDLLSSYMCMDVDQFIFDDYSKTSLYNAADEEVGWYAHHSYSH